MSEYDRKWECAVNLAPKKHEISRDRCLTTGRRLEVQGGGHAQRRWNCLAGTVIASVLGTPI
jgi:hypothetical protein